MNFTVRPALPSDATPLAELAARTFVDTFAADNDPDDMAIHLAQAYGPLQQGRELADPNVITLLVEVGAQLVGYAQLRRGSPPSCVAGEAPIELWRFYVAREWHGQGIAQALMRSVDLTAHRAGAARIQRAERQPRRGA
jgi:diamine N-acetyltransferase